MAKAINEKDADKKRKVIVSDLLNLYLENGNIKEALSLTDGALSKKNAWKAIRGALKRLDFYLIMQVKELTKIYPCEKTMSCFLNKIIKQDEGCFITGQLVIHDLIKGKRRIDSLVNWVANQGPFEIRRWLDLKPSISALDEFIRLVIEKTGKTGRLHLQKNFFFEVVEKISKKGKRNVVQFCLNSLLSPDGRIMDSDDFKRALEISGQKIKKTELKRIVLYCAAGKKPYLNIFGFANEFEVPKDMANLFFRECEKLNHYFLFESALDLRISKMYLRKMRKRAIDKGNIDELKNTINVFGPLSNDESEMLIRNCLKMEGCLNANYLKELLPLIKRHLTEEEGIHFVKGAIQKKGGVSDGMEVAKLLNRELSNYELELAKTVYEKQR